MNFRHTQHQVARRTRADWESFDKFLLIKRTSELHATYQIRLLAYRAVQEGRKLVIEVPKACKIHGDLRMLVKQHQRHVQLVRTD